MAENMNNALLITLIGMGLVFAAILLLWGLMVLMVRLFQDKPESKPAEKAEEETITAVEMKETSNDLKMRAAAAAVAVAFAMQHSGSTLYNQSEINTSAWQTALRSTSLNQRAQLFSRKS